jgi:uncharacterized protein
MTAGVQVLSRAAQLPAADWDALVGPDDVFLSSRWLRVAEATAGTEMNYLLSAGPDGLSGGLSGGLATVLATPSSPWLLGRPDTLLEFSARDGLAGAADCLSALPGSPAEALLPSVVCGGRHIGRTRALVRGGPDGAGQDGESAEIDRLVGAAEQLAASRGARSTVFPYVDERDTALRKVLIQRGYASYATAMYSWLPVPAGGFDGYLAMLSGHRRPRVRADRRRVAAAGVQVRMEPLSTALLRPLAELETKLLTKYGGQWSPDQSEPIFGRILAELGDDAVVSTARADGSLCGFALFLRHRDRWVGHRGGFDYAAQGHLPLYFEVAFYHPIEMAPAAGVTEIHYGTGSTPTKHSRGCLSVGQHAFQLITGSAAG